MSSEPMYLSGESTNRADCVHMCTSIFERLGTRRQGGKMDTMQILHPYRSSFQTWLSLSICMTLVMIFNFLCFCLFIVKKERVMPTFSGSSEHFRADTG